MDRIKESIDSLPIAACFFDKKGVLRLINRRMLAISDQLRKTGIQTLSELQAALQFPPKDILCLDPQLRIFRFPDGKHCDSDKRSSQQKKVLLILRSQQRM